MERESQSVCGYLAGLIDEVQKGHQHRIEGRKSQIDCDRHEIFSALCGVLCSQSGEEDISRSSQKLQCMKAGSIVPFSTWQFSRVHIVSWLNLRQMLLRLRLATLAELYCFPASKENSVHFESFFF